MRIENYRVIMRKQLNELRALVRLLDKDSTVEYFNSLSNELQTEFCKLDSRGMRRILREHENKLLENKSITELRKLASKYKILNYSLLTRTEIILKLRSIAND